MIFVAIVYGCLLMIIIITIMKDNLYYNLCCATVGVLIFDHFITIL